MVQPSVADDPVGVAQHLADEVLFPGALETDAADTVPRARLDALAHAGLYGLAGPAWAGGLDADLATICDVIEALASGCLTTTFVWAQHVTTVFVAGACGSRTVRQMVPALCDGTIRSGLALAGSLPGPRRLRATRVEGGWRLTGPCPWVSGWGRIDVMHTAAVTDDGSTVWSLVDAGEHADLTVRRLRLAAVNATATVNLEFHGRFVPEDRVTVVVPPSEPSGPGPATLRRHAALALGVAARCCRLLGPTPLEQELAACRQALATAGIDDVPEARAASSDLAVRSAVTLMSTVGSASLLVGEHAQRLAREALFVSVFAARGRVRDAFLERLGATPRA